MERGETPFTLQWDKSFSKLFGLSLVLRKEVNTKIPFDNDVNMEENIIY